jgi:hypothetical protein
MTEPGEHEALVQGVLLVPVPEPAQNRDHSVEVVNVGSASGPGLRLPVEGALSVHPRGPFPDRIEHLLEVADQRLHRSSREDVELPDSTQTNLWIHLRRP